MIIKPCVLIFDSLSIVEMYLISAEAGTQVERYTKDGYLLTFLSFVKMWQKL